MTPERAVPEEVAWFCNSHQLFATLQHAIQLADACFPPLERLSVEMEVDPETGEEGVVILVGVSMAVDEVLQCKAAYTRRWVDSVPAGPRHLIRLVFCWHDTGQ
jgi:hypothetical protein